MPEPVTKLRAGRDLDALVAERVMGWKRWDTFEDRAQTRPVVRFFRPGVRHPTSYPDYSTDIAAAFEVVEKMRADGWDWRLVTGWQQVSGDRTWEAELWRFRPEEGDASDRQVSLPEAICRAALLVVSQNQRQASNSPLAGRGSTETP